MGVKPLRHAVGQFNSQAHLAGTQQLSASLRGFFNQTANVLGQFQEQHVQERLDEIERENKAEARQGFRDAVAGREADAGLKNDRDYYNQFRTTAAKSAAHDVISDLRGMYKGWRPENGPFEDIAKAHIQAELGEGTGDEYFDTVLAETLTPEVEALSREAELKVVDASIRTAQASAGRLAQQMGAEGDLTAPAFGQLVQGAIAAYPDKTRGEVQAVIMQNLLSGAREGGRAGIQAAVRFMHNEPIDESGRTFSQLFPDVARQHDLELNRAFHSEVTWEAQQQIDEVMRRAQGLSSRIKSDPEAVLTESASLVHVTGAMADRYGGKTAFDQVRNEILRVQIKAAEEVKNRRSTAAAHNGQRPAQFDTKTYHQYQLQDLQSAGNLYDPDLDPESRDQVAVEWARRLANGYSTMHSVSPDVLARIREGLKPGAHPHVQRGSLALLTSLEGIREDAAQEILKGHPKAAAVYRRMKDAQAGGFLDMSLEKLNEDPGLFEQATEMTDADLRKATGLDSGMSVIDALVTGETQFFGEDTDGGLLPFLEEEGIIGNADSYFIDPQGDLARTIEDSYRTYLVEARKDGRDPTLAEFYSRLRSELKHNVAYSETTQASPGLMNWFRDVMGYRPHRMRRMELRKVIDGSGSSFDAPAPLGASVVNPAGEVENTFESMHGAMERAEEALGGTKLLWEQNSRTGQAGVYDLMRVTDDGVMAPAVFKSGTKYSLPTRAALPDSVDPMEPGQGFSVGNESFDFTLTGDPAQDAASLEVIRSVAGLPDEVGMTWDPMLEGYRLTISPRFTKPEWWDYQQETGRAPRRLQVTNPITGSEYDFGLRPFGYWKHDQDRALIDTGVTP